ncbi:MAG: ABC transporter permease [Methanomassiliicoccus sp.]|nr:ABC transporter permease [Methanomassiliicoccus sp.]
MRIEGNRITVRERAQVRPSHDGGEALAIDDAIARNVAHFTSKTSRVQKWTYRAIVGLVGLAIILLAWQAVSMWVYEVKGVVYPSPLDTASRLIYLLEGSKLYDHTILEHVSSSIMRWATGYLLAVASGIVIGMLMGANPVLNSIGMTPMTVLQLIPGLAWIPIALLLFGLGETSTVFMIYMTVLPAVAISTASGIRGTPPIYRRAASSLGTSNLGMFFRVLLPAASLHILNGLRIGLANGWRVLIAAEMVVGIGLGLGYVLVQARWSLDYEAAFVSILLICGIGLFIEKILFSVAERRVRDRLGLGAE